MIGADVAISAPLLGLLHPDGSAARTLVLGRGCPDALVSGSRAWEDGARADLVVLAPTSRESSDRGWLRERAERAAAAVSPDGVVYVLAPPIARRRVLRRLRSRGVRPVLRLVHLPDASESRQLVPLERTPLEAAARDATTAWRRVALRAVARSRRGQTLLAAAGPSVGVAAQRPDATPLFRWLDPEDGSPVATVARGWRDVSATVLTAYRAGSDEPTSVLKVASTPERADALRREEASLRTVARTAAAAGAAVPAVVGATEVGGAHALVLEPVGGRLAAPALLARAVQPGPLLDRVADWLETWAVATRGLERLTAERLEEALLEPAAALAPFLERGPAFERHLAARCRSLEGAEIPVVATHGDLTMWNVLLGDDGTLAIVDWESARPDGLPLGDLAYATVDAHLLARGGTDRAAVFRALFGPVDDELAGYGPRARRTAEALALPPEVVALCIDACWLSHARNEQRDAAPGERRPFLEILDQLAARRTGR